MEQTPTPGRRLNVLGKAARRKRIFARLREGWAYDEIAGEERVSAERIRQIVSEVLDKRVIDRGVDHAHLQLERLMPALRIVGRGDRTRRAQGGRPADQGDRSARQAPGHGRGEIFLWAGGAAAAARQDQPPRRQSPAGRLRGRPRRRQTTTKIISQKFPRNPLKRLDSDERIQGNPSFSNPH